MCYIYAQKITEATTSREKHIFSNLSGVVTVKSFMVRPHTTSLFCQSEQHKSFDSISGQSF